MISTLAKPDTIVSGTTPSNTTTPTTATTTTPVMKTAVKKRVVNPSKLTTEVPIFLRKTYHMIDTCDSSISSWSEDGETFIVKQPEIFETKIIPQFFKHSKFSSFVRQLNFYGFRKIKFTDTIKIDAQLEKETRNFWRFKHESFVRGRPDLLGDIKRSNSQTSEKKAAAAKAQHTGTTNGTPSQDVVGLKTEVNTLKNKIEFMTANIDKLTTLVEDMKLEKCIKVEDAIAFDHSAASGSKRKKVESTGATAGATGATVGTVARSAVAVPTATASVVNVNTISALPPLPPMVQSPSPQGGGSGTTLPPETSLFPDQITSRSQTVGSTVSDDAFVDELFHAFQDEDMEILPPDSYINESSSVDSEMDVQMKPEPVSSSSVSSACTLDSELAPIASPTPSAQSNTAKSNAPDPELMAKLSDALAVLPKEIQEMLVNRLISTITSSDALKAHVDQVTQAQAKAQAAATIKNVSAVNTCSSTNNSATPTVAPLTATSIESNPEVLPLAAATLAALISQYSAAINSKTCEAVGAAAATAAANTTNGNKSLSQVIPIHA